MPPRRAPHHTIAFFLIHTPLLSWCLPLPPARSRKPIIVLSDELVRRPEPMLRAVCAALELPFESSMLHWSKGPKPYDGVWAPWWYTNTHRSTGAPVCGGVDGLAKLALSSPTSQPPQNHC